MATMKQLQTKSQSAHGGDAVRPTAGGLLQRKRACGGTTGARGECEECKKKKLQHKADGSSAGAGRHSGVPPIVHEVLRSPGQPLDANTRAFMEPRFGHDFSTVRVHTDSKAAESARAVDAAAYTVGRNVVLGKGQNTAGTETARRLLAHELTHVVQQNSAPMTIPLVLADPQGPYEREADAAATRFAAREPSPVLSRFGNAPHPAIAGRTVQRSLLGSIVGGVGGALGGAVLGGFLGGPIGAAIGGVAGLIGGALLGDKVSTKSRSLTGTEIKYAKDIFKQSVDYSVITITRDSLLSAGAPKTIANTIHLKSDWGHFKGDTMELTPVGMETLIHEMGHVWQYQNGGLAYIPESLWAQLKAAASGKTRNAAYDWRAAHDAGLPWQKWNPEQQAEAIEDYNKLLRRSKEGTTTLAELRELSTLLPYMQNVWRRQGAPGFATPRLEGSPI